MVYETNDFLEVEKALPAAKFSIIEWSIIGCTINERIEREYLDK